MDLDILSLSTVANNTKVLDFEQSREYVFLAYMEYNKCKWQMLTHVEKDVSDVEDEDW